jgi:hypothetical protein
MSILFWVLYFSTKILAVLVGKVKSELVPWFLLNFQVKILMSKVAT